jgi:hypothetical protein
MAALSPAWIADIAVVIAGIGNARLAGMMLAHRAQRLKPIF